MSKGNRIKCHYCGDSMLKKRDDHKYCKTSCRTSAYRKRKGIPEPDFLRGSKRVNKSLQSKPSQLIPTNTVQIRTPDQALLIVQQQIQYYENIVSEAGANVLPLWMLGLGVLGYASGKGGAGKVALGIVGGTIGKQFDANRKKRIVQTAKENIKLLKSEYRNMIAAQQVAKIGLNKGTVKQERKGVMKVISTDDYKSKNIPSLGLDRNTPWHYLFGDPSSNFMAMLHGLPGNGKSTFSVQLADYFQKYHGDVMYIASEQSGFNKSLQDLLNQYADNSFSISNDAKDHTYDKILKASKEYKLVILDSINHIGLSASEFENIREQSPNTAFLAIMQSKKDGDFKGTQEWAHNCDIIIEMRNMIAHQTKSRFAPPANIKIIRE